MREEDLKTMEQLLKAANNELVLLYTSSISVAECVSAGDDHGDEVQKFFKGALTSGAMFRLIQDTIFVAERARNLRWEQHLNFKGADSIHIASAIEEECTEFLTWDTDMNKSKISEKTIYLASVGISVITPGQTKLLPPLYDIRNRLIN
jgi:predicted nucleic acid-binding protein